MRQTILSAGCLTISRFASDNERYRHVIKLLNTCGEKLLVVLDNANSIDPNDEEFKKFCEGKYTKLVLTRDEWVKQYFTHVAIGTLSEDELRQIYINNKYGITTRSSGLPREDGSSEEIKSLIHGAHFNTFAVELMGKLAFENSQLQPKLCQELQGKHGVVSSESLPIIVINHDRHQESTIKEHLLWLVSSRKYGDLERRMLGLFSLLSVYGVPKAAIYQWGGNSDGNLKAVNKLVQHGLLVQEDSEDGEEYILLHPLLRDIFYEKFECKSGDFPSELKGILAELEQPRGLWMQNLLCISERMHTWEDSNAHTFLQSAFMKSMEYGVEGPAKSIQEHYLQLPDGRKPLSKQIYQSYMDGILLWKYRKTSGDILQAEGRLREAKKQCEDGKKRCIAEHDVWIRCCLALGEICWESGREDEVKQYFEALLTGLQSWAQNDPRLIEEILCAMSRFDKILTKREDMIPQLLEMGAAMRSGQQRKRMNWLKLNLAFANMARSAKDYDQKAVIWYLDQAIQYGDNHKLKDSIEYREAERLKLNLETELATTEEE